MIYSFFPKTYKRKKKTNKIVYLMLYPYFIPIFQVLVNRVKAQLSNKWKLSTKAGLLQRILNNIGRLSTATQYNH